MGIKSDSILIFLLLMILGPDQLIIFGVGADPKPDEALFNLNSQGPVLFADPDRPKSVHLFKMQ